MKRETVFVGLSGGVDSSVAAARLLARGYNVVGVFIKVWQPDWLVCNWEQERLDAMRVAAKLGIPFLTCDAQKEYETDVANYFIAEYTAGRTPNPDVMCNKHVKFGAFLDFAKAHGADHIATGHYAQLKQSETGITMWRGRDSNKDQSYFLWTLTQEQLQHTLLPVGDSPKTTIREEARATGLLTATKKDSQGICFLGHIDIPEFLSHYVDLQSGAVLDSDGTVIGEHQEALVYTTGQRHGFQITKNTPSEQPHYVIGRDLHNNTITVATERPVLPSGSVLTLSETNFIGYTPQIGSTVEAQVRYRQIPFTATIISHKENQLTVSLAAESDSPSEGQSCVLYEGERCLGGGIISQCQ